MRSSWEYAPLLGLTATLAAGVLGTEAGAGLAAGDLAAFFAKVREWYGHDASLLAPIDANAEGYSAPTFEGFPYPTVLSNANPTPAYPTLDQFRVDAAADTSFESFRVYVPWVAWGRGGGRDGDRHGGHDDGRRGR